MALRFCPSCHSIYTAHVDHCGIDGAALEESDRDPLVGRAVDRYRVLERIGAGAMGCVYRVMHRVLEHEYAMKVLFGDLGADRRVAERFRREAQVASKLRHPNLVRVEDFGTSSSGLTFYVMELCPGRPLDEILRGAVRFSPHQAGQIARQIASGLAECHRHGFVHRDVKPSNVMADGLPGEEFIRILDFGVVGVRQDALSTHITGTGQVVGTPRYMSPEQARDPRQVTPAADLYSLGCLTYEMLAGHPPFRDDTVVDLLVAHSRDKPPPLPAAGGLEMLVGWLLEKRVEDRPRSALDVVSEIDRLRLPRVSADTETIETNQVRDREGLSVTRDGASDYPQ